MAKEVVIKNERLVKEIQVDIEENVILNGSLNFINNATILTDGTLDVRILEGERVKEYIPVGFRVQDGKATFAPGRMDSDLLGKVLEGLKAIENTFAEEIANNVPNE